MVKKGYTLLELIVAMGIFVISLSLMVGAFVTISRMKALTSSMKEVQQKSRITIERISRLARQSDRAFVSPDGKTLDLYFSSETTNISAERFQITADAINQHYCTDPNLETNKFCDATKWGPGSNMLGSQMIPLPSSVFEKKGTIPPVLDIRLEIEIGTLVGNPYYRDNLVVSTEVILEGIR